MFSLPNHQIQRLVQQPQASRCDIPLRVPSGTRRGIFGCTNRTVLYLKCNMRHEKSQVMHYFVSRLTTAVVIWNMVCSTVFLWISWLWGISLCCSVCLTGKPKRTESKPVQLAEKAGITLKMAVITFTNMLQIRILYITHDLCMFLLWTYLNLVEL